MACCFFDSVDAHACHARVIWQPDLCHTVLPVQVLPCSGTSLGRFFFEDHRFDSTLLIDEQGGEHLLLRQDDRSLQLACNGVSLLTHDVTLTYPIFAGLPKHLDVLQALAALQTKGALPPRFFPPDPRSRRLGQVLQVLDGWLTGTSHREIAVAIFGEQRVQAEWRSGDTLRDWVRHTLRRGRALMSGGYKQLLT
jgi:hypothetical protein